MKYLTLLVAALSGFACYGQPKEEFLNSVFRNFVPPSFSKYYLHSNAIPLLIRKGDSALIKELSVLVSGKTLHELIDGANSDTIASTWECNQLDSAECVQSSAVILLNYYFVNAKRKWSKRKLRKETARQIARQKKQYEARPRQERTMYRFSRPIFDKRKEFCMFSMYSTCGSLCGYSCLCLFRKHDTEWRIITKTRFYYN